MTNREALRLALLALVKKGMVHKLPRLLHCIQKEQNYLSASIACTSSTLGRKAA